MISLRNTFFGESLCPRSQKAAPLANGSKVAPQKTLTRNGYVVQSLVLQKLTERAIHWNFWIGCTCLHNICRSNGLPVLGHGAQPHCHAHQPVAHDALDLGDKLRLTMTHIAFLRFLYVSQVSFQSFICQHCQHCQQSKLRNDKNLLENVSVSSNLRTNCNWQSIAIIACACNKQ